MNRKVKEKTKGPNGVNDGVVGNVGCVLVLEILGGRGVTLCSKIFNIFFSDISPITKKSSSLVSHFPL